MRTLSWRHKSEGGVRKLPSECIQRSKPLAARYRGREDVISDWRHYPSGAQFLDDEVKAGY